MNYPRDIFYALSEGFFENREKAFSLPANYACAPLI